MFTKNDTRENTYEIVIDLSVYFDILHPTQAIRKGHKGEPNEK
jgi:hypothetical protein